MATKQKIELKIQMGGRDGHRKAMVIAAKKCGIESISVDGDKLVVTGVRINLVKLVKSLQKKVGCTQIVTVEEVKKDKEKTVEEVKKDKEKKEEKPPVILYSHPYSYPPPMYAMYDTPAPDHPCSIL